MIGGKRLDCALQRVYGNCEPVNRRDLPCLPRVGSRGAFRGVAARRPPVFHSTCAEIIFRIPASEIIHGNPIYFGARIHKFFETDKILPPVII